MGGTGAGEVPSPRGECETSATLLLSESLVRGLHQHGVGTH